MDGLLWVLLGGILAVPYCLFAARQPQWPGYIALGLLLAAVIYLGFALLGGAKPFWLLLELLGVLFYGLFAWLGLKRSAWFLSLGWAIHIAWDVLLHQSGPGASYTPYWYPEICIGFDILVAIAVLILLLAKNQSHPWPRIES